MGNMAESCRWMTLIVRLAMDISKRESLEISCHIRLPLLKMEVSLLLVFVACFVWAYYYFIGAEDASRIWVYGEAGIREDTTGT